MSYDRKDFSVSALLLDSNNPRLGDGVEGQHNAIRELAAEQGAKLLALATHLVDNGQDPCVLACRAQRDRITLSDDREDPGQPRDVACAARDPGGEG